LVFGSSSGLANLSYANTCFVAEFRVPIVGWTATSEHVVTPAISGIEEVSYSGFTGSVTGNRIKYKTLERSTLSRVAVADNSGNYTKFTALKKCIAFICSSNRDASSGSTMYITWVNSAETLKGQKGNYSNNNGSITYPIIMEPGDYVWSDVSADPDDSTDTNFSAIFIDFYQQVLSAIPRTYSQYIRYDGYNGYGSTNTKIPQLGTLTKNKGDALLVPASTAAAGASFTCMKECDVHLAFKTTWGDYYVGWTVNSAQLTTIITDIYDLNTLVYVQYKATAPTRGHSTTVHLNVGDVLRPHTQGTAYTAMILELTANSTVEG
jgi:hypothetical protein